ncbi:MAG TPA: HAMP domain-containing sensor histidine kinase [Rhizobacter sp.]|jgi:two-component system OmpR family sensor kinase|nr:HAMP domain-containing sensor histidine kinase [Rhizobacter sp.]
MTQRRWSLARVLRRRLLAAVALLWTAAAVVATVAVRHELNAVLDSALLSVAEQIPLESTPRADDTTPSLPAVPQEEVMHVLVRNAQGKVLRKSGPTSHVPWPLDAAPGLQTVSGWRVATRRTIDNQLIVQVGEPLNERRQSLTESTAALVLPLLALLPLATLLIDLLLRRSFMGVQQASEQMRARPEGDISPLQANDLPSEFEPMMASINALVDRLQGVVRAERAFAASSAHELRTPLAAARAQAQRLVAELPELDAQERALALVRSLDRLSNTATKLLQISRVESGIGLAREPVDLRQLATLVLDEFRHHADAVYRLAVELPDQPVIVQGDMDALGIAIRNLIENALKHAPEAKVEVRVEAPGRVVVSDDGPGASKEVLATLSQPYSRGSTRTEGTGLGLAIVARIAQQQHATLILQSPPPGKPHGFRATLTIALA